MDDPSVFDDPPVFLAEAPALLARHGALGGLPEGAADAVAAQDAFSGKAASVRGGKVLLSVPPMGTAALRVTVKPKHR